MLVGVGFLVVTVLVPWLVVPVGASVRSIRRGEDETWSSVSAFLIGDGLLRDVLRCVGIGR